MEVFESKIGYPYITVILTQGRINKGLIALPKALDNLFPQSNSQINVYLGQSSVLQLKKFTSRSSSTNESRIGGLREWFEKNQVKDGDEIVIQLINKENCMYRLIIEKEFISLTENLQNKFDLSNDDNEAVEKIKSLANWIGISDNQSVVSEFHRLSSNPFIEKRKKVLKPKSQVKEKVPPNLRFLLTRIYKGHCQICDFWFLMKNQNPYFEIHHINDQMGNFPQNLLVTCGNCHNQFTYAEVKQEFLNDWLTTVYFNNIKYKINQIILSNKMEEPRKRSFIL